MKNLTSILRGMAWKARGVALVIICAGICLLSVEAMAGNIEVAEMGIATGTTCVLIDSGAGSLFTIYKSSGNNGDYVICRDSASITGIAVDTDGAGKALYTLIQSSVPSTAAGANNSQGASLPASLPPAPYTNGLVCCQSAANGRAYIVYREN